MAANIAFGSLHTPVRLSLPADILRSQEQPAAIPDPLDEDATASASTSSHSSSSSSPSSRHHAASQQQQQQQQLVGGDPRYGYAVLGGIVPDEAQDDSNLTHLQLHPERQFRHGDTYTPTVSGGTCSRPVNSGCARTHTAAVGTAAAARRATGCVRSWWCSRQGGQTCNMP